MNEIDLMKQKLERLVNSFELNYDKYKSSEYNESECRLEYIDLLFECLGWDVNNKKHKDPRHKEVIVESYNRDYGKPDYSMTFNGIPMFFVEAKKPAVDILNDKDCAFQAKKYGWSANHKISVLTNFEYLMIYDTTLEPNKDDFTNNSLIGLYNYKEYIDKYDEIYSKISRENVYNGTFEDLFSKNESLGLTIDQVFLKQINEWRLKLGNYLYQSNKDLESINQETQEIINQIIFLRICEDRNLPVYQKLNIVIEDSPSKLKTDLQNIILKANRKYNSGLFKNYELITSIDDSILKEIIKSLYYPVSPYDFSVISSNLLGDIYEIFLAETLALEDNKLIIKPKASYIDKSIVTTPNNIVKFMVDRCLSDKISGKSPSEIKKMKFADIACGSGVFLTQMLEYIINYCEQWYIENNKIEKLIEIHTDEYKIKFSEKKDILVSCIYGNDIDIRAVEVAKLSLLLKILENEDSSTLDLDESILPSLDNNIYMGNSLIDFSMIDVDRHIQEAIQIKPFSWDLVLDNKFDLIIGNPPYAKTEDIKNNVCDFEYNCYSQYYKTAYKQYDKYYLFVERAHSLLNDDGLLCYIIPNKFAKIASGKELRKLIYEKKLLKLFIDFNFNQVFKDKTTYTSIVELSNKTCDTFEYNYIEDYNYWKANCNEIDNISYNSDLIDDKIWMLSNNIDDIQFYKKISKNSISLSDIATPFNGIQTSANKVYVISEKEIIKETEGLLYFKKGDKEYAIEKQLLKKYYQPTAKGEKNLGSYDPLFSNKFIIFPYDNEGSLLDLTKDEYKNGYNYLKDFYDDIVPKQVSGRPGDRDIPNSTQDTWYQYGRVQALTEFNGEEKLIVGVLTNKPKYFLDRNNYVIQSGGTAGYVGIKIKPDNDYSLEFLQAYLSNPFVDKYISIVGSNFEGGFSSRGTNVLNNIPVIKIDFHDNKEKELYDLIVNNINEIYRLNSLIINSNNKEKIVIYNRTKEALIKDIDKSINKLIEMKG